MSDSRLSKYQHLISYLLFSTGNEIDNDLMELIKDIKELEEENQFLNEELEKMIALYMQSQQGEKRKEWLLKIGSQPIVIEINEPDEVQIIQQDMIERFRGKKNN